VSSTRRERVLLAAVIYVVLLAQVLLYPGLGRLVATLGATTDLQPRMWFLGAEFGAFILFVGVWGAVSDATGRRVPWIVVGALGGAVGYGILALLPRLSLASFETVLILRVVQGAATIGAFSLAITMLMDLDGGHGRNMGAAGIAIGLGTAMGAPIGGQLTELSPVAPLYAATVLLAAVGLLVTLVEDRAPQGRRSTREALATIRRTPTLSIPYAFGMIDRMTAGFFALVGVAYFESAFDLSPGESGIMLALFFAPFALLQYPMGALSDRIGRTIPIVVGSSLYGLGIAAIGLVERVEFAGAGMVVIGVLGALLAPATMALVTDVANDIDRGTAMAGFNLFGSVGFFAGFLLGGVIADAYSYPLAFLVVGGLEVLIAIVTLPAFLKLGLGDVPTVTAGSSD
jgi:MFS family permease